MDEHPTADLALVSVQTEMDGETMSFPANKFAARMPGEEEKLRGFGYPRSGMSGSAPIATAAIIDYERRLVQSSGPVIERHPVRRDSSAINFPAVMTNAHDEHGMSGGPVIDADGVIIGVISRGMPPDDDGGDWVSYVSLIGPALQLTGLLGSSAGSEEEVRLGQLAMEDKIGFELYDSFEVIGGPDGIEVRYTLGDDSAAC
ncbi:serine protease [uncultured Jatrophihabitans sp.]|uniref:S1 family peptidase n=1 Tax=uncultured Jatrophihabitans sp. TaxID=1610747 RepID=UPI0035CA53AF